MWCLSSISSSLFLSTPSARRATRHSKDKSNITVYFYPRPPRGGRHDHVPTQDTETGISIHALREEGDARKGRDVNLTLEFLSTPSARRATKLCGYIDKDPDISIHALREEGDQQCAAVSMQSSYFYPRPPRGGRHPARFADVAIKQFLSTPSARRATATEFQGRFGSFDFYPRPPRGGRHQAAGNNGSARPDFYPRPPRGGRLPLFGVSLRNQTISIHALREEGDVPYAMAAYEYFGFLSTPSARRATVGTADKPAPYEDFYPRPPRGGRPALDM